MNLVRVFRCRNNYEEVVALGTKVLSKKMSSTNDNLRHQIVTDVEFSLMVLGQIAISKGDEIGQKLLNEAYEVCRQVVIEFPDSIDAWYYLSHCAFMNRDNNACIVAASMYLNLLIDIKTRVNGVVYETYGSQDIALQLIFMSRMMNSKWLSIPGS
jgi:hypothetical protein